AIENSATEVTFWLLITIVYIVSLIVAYFVIARWEKVQTL
ncbi:unnamed protein product, partial [marine sediment metagenome]